MQDSSEPQAPSQGPDFNRELREAQRTGDFDSVLAAGKQSHTFFVEFRDLVSRAQFPGTSARTMAAGLNFLESCIANAASQLDGLKRLEKQTKERLKAEKSAPELTVVEPQAEAPVA